MHAQAGNTASSITDSDFTGLGANRASVARLAAGLGVEGCAIEHDDLIVDMEHGCCGGDLIAASEDRFAMGFHQRNQARRVTTDADLATSFGPLLLVSHRPTERFDIDGDVSFGGDLLGNFEWEAVGVVQ